MWRTEGEERLVQVRLQAYRFELRPDRKQRHQMLRFAGSCRFVFNRALALQKELFELSGAHASYADLCAVLVDWKQDKETDWLNEAPSQALQQSLKNLDAAWARRWDSLKKLKQGRIKRAQLIGEPVFKKKEKHASFRYPQGTCLEQNNNRILLPKLGWVRYRNSREVLGAVKNVTVSLAGGRWMVSIQTEREVEAPVHRSATAVGIDMGVVRLATLSDGTFYGPRNSLRQHQAGLRKAQQSMSRKKKFSQNWKRAKARLACLHIRVANARRDYLHKASTAISKNHAIVCVEDLRVSNMSSSAAGSMQSPGSKVRAKSGLNRSILDQGWAELRRQLEYKLGWNGGRLIAVPAINTSRTCPECRCTGQGNRKSQARFCCVECGYEANADLVAAINVGRAGLARIACEVNDGVSRQQQEPTSVAAWPRRLESPSFRCPLGGGGRQHAANWIHSFVVAESSEKASRFVPEVSRLAGLREPTPEGYESLAGLLSSEGTIGFFLDAPYQDRRGWNLIAVLLFCRWFARMAHPSQSCHLHQTRSSSN